MGGLTLRLPTGWQAVDVPDDGPREVRARGFVSTERLTAYGSGRPCPKDTPEGCLPVGALPPGGALLTLEALTLEALKESGAASGIERAPELYLSDDPSPACRAIHGTREFNGLLGGAPAPFTAVAVTLCVSGDAPGTVEDVRTMVTGADFGRGTVTAPPPTPPPSIR